MKKVLATKAEKLKEQIREYLDHVRFINGNVKDFVKGDMDVRCAKGIMSLALKISNQPVYLKTKFQGSSKTKFDVYFIFLEENLSQAKEYVKTIKKETIKEIVNSHAQEFQFLNMDDWELDKLKKICEELLKDEIYESEKLREREGDTEMVVRVYSKPNGIKDLEI